MLILGIGTLRRNSAAALFDDSGPVAAFEEEKLDRTAGMGGVPHLAIAHCLQRAEAKLSDLALAAVAGRPRVAGRREAAFRLSLALARPEAADGRRFLGRYLGERTLDRQLRQFLGQSVPLVEFEHHLCHAASAYYTSACDRSLILTLDECGDLWSGLLSLGEGEEIRLLRSLRFPNSLGWFYSRVTELLGLRPHRDEHKVQWLSKDGRPDFVAAFRKLFARDADGLPVLRRRYFAKGQDDRGAFSAELYRELGLDPSAPSAGPGVRAARARSAQDVVEEIVLEIAERYRVKTGAHSLCLAGGLFLNVLLVRALETRSRFDRVYVQPVAGNAGAALGAAFLARKQLAGRPGRSRWTHLSLGPELAPAATKAVLDNCKILYKYLSGDEHLFEQVAQLLLRDKIVAWCQGRTEFGHRALGNRSILASPFSEYVVENVNQYIKHREDFHPFALSVPAERAPEFFDCTSNCNFMASLGALKPDIPALVRFTFHGREVRVHTVERDANPRFWALLHKFGERTPAPILVNTSFNLFGEPLVSDPREAVRSFYCAGIDALAIGNFLVTK